MFVFTNNNLIQKKSAEYQIINIQHFKLQENTSLFFSQNKSVTNCKSVKCSVLEKI